MGIISIVESEHELIQVGLEVLSRNTVINADDRSFEERPERLDSHYVYVPVDERLRMTNDRVRTAANRLNIAPEFIRDE